MVLEVLFSLVMEVTVAMWCLTPWSMKCLTEVTMRKTTSPTPSTTPTACTTITTTQTSARAGPETPRGTSRASTAWPSLTAGSSTYTADGGYGGTVMEVSYKG